MIKLKVFIKNSAGATMMEWVMILALIALVCVAGMTYMSNDVSSTFNNISSGVTSAVTR